MDEIILREALETDAEGIVRLLNEVDHPVTEDVIQQRLRHIKQVAHHDRILIALKTNMVVGLCTVHFTPVLHRPYNDVGRITLLVVLSMCRGNGIGRILVEAAEEIIKTHGSGRVEVTSSMERKRAHRFYENIGYVIEGIRCAKLLE